MQWKTCPHPEAVLAFLSFLSSMSAITTVALLTLHTRDFLRRSWRRKKQPSEKPYSKASSNMATKPTEIPGDDDDHGDSCTLCSIKYERTRPSFCQCKHCSIPLCVDCMKEHHDELLQSVAEISHHYNELHQLIKTKQTVIINRATKVTENINRYFDELRAKQMKMLVDVEAAKQKAQVWIIEVAPSLCMPVVIV
jgi:hypothetical protein